MCFFGGNLFTTKCKYYRYYQVYKILSHIINCGRKLYDVDIFIIVIYYASGYLCVYVHSVFLI